MISWSFLWVVNMIRIYFDPVACLESSAPLISDRPGCASSYPAAWPKQRGAPPRRHRCPWPRVVSAPAVGNVKSWAGFCNSLGEKMLKNINQSINQWINLSIYQPIYLSIYIYIHMQFLHDFILPFGISLNIFREDFRRAKGERTCLSLHVFTMGYHLSSSVFTSATISLPTTTR